MYALREEVVRQHTRDPRSIIASLAARISDVNRTEYIYPFSFTSICELVEEKRYSNAWVSLWLPFRNVGCWCRWWTAYFRRYSIIKSLLSPLITNLRPHTWFSLILKEWFSRKCAVVNGKCLLLCVSLMFLSVRCLSFSASTFSNVL